MPSYFEFPVHRGWARKLIHAGKKPLVQLRVTDTQDVMVRLLFVPADGLVLVKLPSGFEAHVPIAALRRRSNAATGETPTGDGRQFPTPPPEAP